MEEPKLRSTAARGLASAGPPDSALDGCLWHQRELRWKGKDKWPHLAGLSSRREELARLQLIAFAAEDDEADPVDYDHDYHFV